MPAAPCGKVLLPPRSHSVPLVSCAGLTVIFPLTSKMPCCFRSGWGGRIFEEDQSISAKTLQHGRALDYTASLCSEAG